MHDLVNVQDFSSLVVADDWAPAFAVAIEIAFTYRRSGVFVPASRAPYTVKKPGPQRPSIDLRGVDPGDGTLHPITKFTLAGEGSRSVIQMTGSGGGGSWALIHVGGHAEDITIRDLFLDGMFGSDTSPTELDKQTHLIRLGGSNASHGGARNVQILNCVLTRAFGDGIAILPSAETADAGEEVQRVRIAACNFIHNHRSGISNQRSARHVHILHNYFEGDPDQHGQAIDLEPTGNVPDSGPSGYLILGNTFVHSSHSVCVTLSGVSGDIPASDNIFAYNQIRGGSLGMVHARRTSIVGNYIEGALSDDGTVVRFSGKIEAVRFCGNHVVRPPGATPGQVLAISSRPRTVSLASQSDIDAATDEFTQANHGFFTGTGPVRLTTTGTLPTGLSAATDYWVIRVDDDVFRLAATRADALGDTAIDITDAGTGTTRITLLNVPCGVDVHDNQLRTHVPVHVPRQGEDAPVTFSNARHCSFRNNDLRSYSGVIISNAVRFDSSAAVTAPAGGWDITGNRYGGNLRQDPTDTSDVFTSAIMIRAGSSGVENIRINFNNFEHCTNQIFWTAESGSAYRTIPMVTGNNGSGIPYLLGQHADFPAIMIGGNDGGHALYSGSGKPSFRAALGSMYMRTDGSGGHLLYVNTDGAVSWNPFA